MPNDHGFYDYRGNKCSSDGVDLVFAFGFAIGFVIGAVVF